MTSPELAQLSNLALYAAMGLLACAMLAFALYLGRVVPSRAAQREAGQQLAAQEAEVLVGSAGSTRAGSPPAGEHDTRAAAEAAAARQEPGFSGSLGMSLTYLATFLLLVSILLRGLATSRPPVANLFEFAVAAVTATLVVYAVLAQRKPVRWLGLFVVVPALCVLGIALISWYVPAAELAPALQSWWISIHVPVAIISYGFFTVAFCVLLLQLWVERAERRQAAGELPAGRTAGLLATVPSGARLDRLAYSLNVAGFPLWTFTIIAGAIWGQQAWGTYWSWDPKEVWSFVIWALYAAYLHARATSGQKRRTANIIAVVAYLAIIVNTTVVNMFFAGMHSYAGL